MSEQSQLFKINSLMYRIGNMSIFDFFLYFGFPPAIVATAYLYVTNPNFQQKLDSVPSALFSLAGLTVGFGTAIFIISSLVYLLTSQIIEKREKERENEIKRISEVIANNDSAASEFAKRVANHLNAIKQPEHLQNLQLEEIVSRQQYDINELKIADKQKSDEIAELKKQQHNHEETDRIYMRTIQNQNTELRIDNLKINKLKNLKETLKIENARLEKRIVEKNTHADVTDQNTNPIKEANKFQPLD